MSPSLRCCSRKQPARKENKRKAKKKKKNTVHVGKKGENTQKNKMTFPP